jgi:hypothetical protein
LCPIVALQIVEFSPIREPGPTITSSSRTLFLKNANKIFNTPQFQRPFFAPGLFYTSNCDLPKLPFYNEVSGLVDVVSGIGVTILL